jgi:hypothetical protein
MVFTLDSSSYCFLVPIIGTAKHSGVLSDGCIKAVHGGWSTPGPKLQLLPFYYDSPPCSGNLPCSTSKLYRLPCVESYEIFSGLLFIHIQIRNQFHP